MTTVVVTEEEGHTLLVVVGFTSSSVGLVPTAVRHARSVAGMVTLQSSATIGLTKMIQMLSNKCILLSPR